MVTHGLFVCPTVSMVTTSHATGLEKTLLVPSVKRQGPSLYPILQSKELYTPPDRSYYYFSIDFLRTFYCISSVLSEIPNYITDEYI